MASRSIFQRVTDALSYPRAWCLTIFGALWTLFMSVIVVFTAVVIRNRRAVDFTINRMWAWTIIKLAGVRVVVRGAERVRKDGDGFLILFNHGSLFDILVLYVYFPRSFRFGAKIELFKIPLFGAAMRAVGVLPIDRRNRARVMKIYDEAIARVKNGESFALAPEGTRQNEPRLGSFKRGPFEFAINAQMDVVPVLIAGAMDVLPANTVLINRGRWSRVITLDILKPAATAGLEVSRAAELEEQTRARMLPVYERAVADLNEV